jgi:DNA ligase-1
VREFAQLFAGLDSTTRTNTRIDMLAAYFASDAPEEDKLWAVALLSGKRPKRPVNTTLLRQWAAAKAGVPDWLFEESYHVVGDLAETISLLVSGERSDNQHSLTEWIEMLIALKDKDETEKEKAVKEAWSQLNRQESFIFNKIITGSFRIGISQSMVVKALSKYTGKEESTLAHRLMGQWVPQLTSFHELVMVESMADDASRPYPFYLAYPLEDEPESLGDIVAWQIEHKWDGIRGQFIKRNNLHFVWTRGEELVTDKYPELGLFAPLLPDGTVIDGEIIVHNGSHPLPFQLLQTRIGRKAVSKKLLKEAPVSLIAYDLLEHEGVDIRSQPLTRRRALLAEVVQKANHPKLLISKELSFAHWQEAMAERAGARAKFNEGLMLKRRSSVYQSGRRRGDWWKWKIEPLVIDAVLIYAMRGHGRRADLYTDYTFAVWDGAELVPFTKAYSGLTDQEFGQVDHFVKRNTVEKFGPVRSVKPELVFEIAFEGIAASSRHKSGIALRFPRMNRWRKDKKAGDANTLNDLKQMLKQYG